MFCIWVLVSLALVLKNGVVQNGVYIIVLVEFGGCEKVEAVSLGVVQKGVSKRGLYKRDGA